jgi:hypothetical protein
LGRPTATFLERNASSSGRSRAAEYPVSTQRNWTGYCVISSSGRPTRSVRLGGFSRAGLDEFGSSIYQALFAKWKAGGSAAVTREIGERKPHRGTFRAVELPFTYRLFSRLEAA